jgi:hypothetical protein
VLCVSGLGSGVFVEISRGAELAQSQKLRIKFLKALSKTKLFTIRCYARSNANSRFVRSMKERRKWQAHLCLQVIWWGNKMTVESFLEL